MEGVLLVSNFRRTNHQTPASPELVVWDKPVALWFRGGSQVPSRTGEQIPKPPPPIQTEPIGAYQYRASGQTHDTPYFASAWLGPAMERLE